MDSKINEVRNANDIVDVISEYIPLAKKGKNFFGVCPFHSDNNPSMSVSKDKQIYKCFSCGASGNVFNFVMDYENVDFKEALNILAKRAGITLSNSYNKKSENQFDKYFEMYDMALKLYQNNLNSDLGKSAKEYLNKRKINEESIRHFKIGLASSDRNMLTKFLKKNEYTDKELDIYGLGNNGYDLYVNRIMFPISNNQGKTVGFSGRIYNTTSDSKYINTKETPIFKKGEIIYNYNESKEHVRLEKKLILVEGFMDVIRLYSNDIKNVVAIMGTSLTKEMINSLKRLSNNIYLCLDGDKAGKSAMIRIGEELINNNFNIKIIELPNDLDPDEYILKNNKESFLNLYNNAINYSDYKINFLRIGKNMNSLEDKTSYINSVLKELEKEEDEIKREFILNKISKEFDLDIAVLKNKLQIKEKSSKISASAKKDLVNERSEKIDKYQKATYGILYAMVNSYESVKAYESKLNYLPSKEARYLANEIIYYYEKNKELILADFLTSLIDKEELLKMLKKVLKFSGDEKVNIDLTNDYIMVIREYKKNQEIKRLKELLKNEPDPIKQSKYLNQIRLTKMGS